MVELPKLTTSNVCSSWFGLFGALQLVHDVHVQYEQLQFWDHNHNSSRYKNMLGIWLSLAKALYSFLTGVLRIFSHFLAIVWCFLQLAATAEDLPN